MSDDRFFLDTSFLLGLFNQRDQSHQKALKWKPRVDAARQVVSTEAIMIEVGNALSSINRIQAAGLIERLLAASAVGDGRIEIVPVDTNLLRRGLRLYSSHGDKQWGLTDCLSFVVMREMGLVDALTADRHFVQAGFRAMMSEEG